MPRAFTSAESEDIRARLKEAALVSFGRRGLRGTTVGELAEAAAISKGAFYRFYDSKEDLFLALLDDSERTMHAELEQAVRADPVGAVDYLVDSAVHALTRHPLLATLLSEEGMRLLRTVPAERRTRLLDRDVRLVDRLMQVMAEAGTDPGVPQRVFVGLLRSLVFVGLHREEIGRELLEEATGWLKQQLRAGLQR